jgi:hypothetical protein
MLCPRCRSQLQAGLSRRFRSVPAVFRCRDMLCRDMLCPLCPSLICSVPAVVLSFPTSKPVYPGAFALSPLSGPRCRSRRPLSRLICSVPAVCPRRFRSVPAVCPPPWLDLHVPKFLIPTKSRSLTSSIAPSGVVSSWGMTRLICSVPAVRPLSPRCPA